MHSPWRGRRGGRGGGGFSEQMRANGGGSPLRTLCSPHSQLMNTQKRIILLVTAAVAAFAWRVCEWPMTGSLVTRPTKSQHQTHQWDGITTFVESI